MDKEFYLSRPIPERLIESLAAAPLVESHKLEMWVRCGGRITNPPPDKWDRLRGIAVTHPPKKLARRELEAIRLFAKGLTHKQVAHKMGVGGPTVTNLIKQAAFRLGAVGTTQTVLAARSAGLVEVFDAENKIIDQLTNGERQALSLWYQGFGAREIAVEMNLNHPTVSAYLRKARRKFGTRNTNEAARLAFS